MAKDSIIINNNNFNKIKSEIPYEKFSQIIKEIEKSYEEIVEIYKKAEHNRRICGIMLERDDFDSTIQILNFPLKVNYNLNSDDDEKRIKADINDLNEYLQYIEGDLTDSDKNVSDIVIHLNALNNTINSKLYDHDEFDEFLPYNDFEILNNDFSTTNDDPYLRPTLAKIFITLHRLYKNDDKKLSSSTYVLKNEVKEKEDLIEDIIEEKDEDIIIEDTNENKNKDELVIQTTKYCVFALSGKNQHKWCFGKTVNGTPTGQQQKTPATSSKLQKISVKTKLKSSSTGINKSPETPTSTTQLPSPKSMLPSPKSSVSPSSNINDPKSPTKKILAPQTAKQTSLTKRKIEDTSGRTVRAASSPNIKKSTTQPPKSIATKNTPRKKPTTVQEQSRISTKKPLNSTTPTRKNESMKLIAELKELRAENKKLQAENKELMQEKGLLTADVCQMEHRLACEESRVLELEVDVADLRCLLNGKHHQIDRNNDHYRSELNIANNLIMEQAVTMSDQQSLIEELMSQLDEQENICQNLQNIIDNFKTKHNILDDLKDINFALQIY
ncbi:3049_t:CDS:2 [Rhizophagus irregularis]|nr:3049_t:CDS:2 [Rhizophagus irregularis]